MKQLHLFYVNCTFFELIASTPSKLKHFRLHLQVVNCAHFIQLYQINYLEQIAIIYSKPQLFGAIYTIANQLLQYHFHAECNFVKYAFTPSNTNWLHFMLSEPTATYLHVCKTNCTYCKPLAMFQPARPT